jgi:dolichol-phosphate mannosyltransferase
MPSKNGEIIFVDDGSIDDSYSILEKLKYQYQSLVSVAKLSRNFGQRGAVLAGYHLAKGDCIITMSADLQDSPEVIVDLLEAHFNEGFEKVICLRNTRHDGVFKKLSSMIAYHLIRILAYPQMPIGGFDFFLMSRRILILLQEQDDSSVFIQGFLLSVGFTTKYIPYTRHARKYGKSFWTFTRQLTFFVDAIASYSYVPIRIISVGGVVLALLGMLYAFFILISYFAFGNPIKGWTPIMIAILVIGGFQMLMTGIIGEYLWRTLSQVRKRQMFIIDKVI